MADPVAKDVAQSLKARLRADLGVAIKARDPALAKVIRTLIGAIDNAQAIDLGNAHEKYVERTFGDSSGEVPRKQLSNEDLRAIILSEIDERAVLAAQFEASGHSGRASELREETRIIEVYLT